MCTFALYFTDKEFKLNVQYQYAENYPVDLYFVMDLSDSLKDDQKMLSQLGDKLGNNVYQTRYLFTQSSFD